MSIQRMCYCLLNDSKYQSEAIIACAGPTLDHATSTSVPGCIVAATSSFCRAEPPLALRQAGPWCSTLKATAERILSELSFAACSQCCLAWILPTARQHREHVRLECGPPHRLSPGAHHSLELRHWCRRCDRMRPTPCQERMSRSPTAWTVCTGLCSRQAVRCLHKRRYPVARGGATYQGAVSQARHQEPAAGQAGAPQTLR